MPKLFWSTIHNTQPYIPSTLSELYDYCAGLIGGAPLFNRKEVWQDEQNIHTEFDVFDKGLAAVRGKLGEERYARLAALSAKAKALFEADPDDNNGKTTEGCRVIWEIEDVIREVSVRRKKARLRDDEGEVTGD